MQALQRPTGAQWHPGNSNRLWTACTALFTCDSLQSGVTRSLALHLSGRFVQNAKSGDRPDCAPAALRLGQSPLFATMHRGRGDMTG